MVEDKPTLTEREMEVLQGIVRGELQAETAQRLGISLSNVEKTVKSIKEKFDSPTPASAAAKAASFGIVNPE